jgi:hypothetical protein
MKDVKDMTLEELVAIWEAWTKAPIDVPASDLVIQVLHEIVDREALE